MTLNARSILAGIANLVAVIVVIGVVSHQMYGNDTKANKSVAEPLVDMDGLPVANKMGHRDLGSKGKGKSSYDFADCIPLYPTFAPTKGKGRSKGKGYYRNLEGTERELGKGKGGKGKGGKGKGEIESEAPSFFCSDAPSLSPSITWEPTTTWAPTYGPTYYPTTGKGKGGKGKGGKGKSGYI